MKTLTIPSVRGFTIKELLMVLVVIGILFGLAIPQFYAMRNAKKQTQVPKIVQETNEPR